MRGRFCPVSPFKGEMSCNDRGVKPQGEMSALADRGVELSNLFDREVESEIEAEITYMGQNSGGYLVFDDGTGITLIDPHAAHERINYEKIKSRAEKSDNVQKLLVPILLHPTLALEAHEFEHELKEAGFEFTNTNSGIELNSIPVIGVEFEAVSLLRASMYLGDYGLQSVREINDKT